MWTLVYLMQYMSNTDVSDTGLFNAGMSNTDICTSN